MNVKVGKPISTCPNGNVFFCETRPVTLLSLVHLDDHLDFANQLSTHHVAPLETLGCPLMNETDEKDLIPRTLTGIRRC